MHGNRETLETPVANAGWRRGRSEKAVGRTTDMHVSRESDGPIVPKKRANKAGPKAAAESVEGRGSTKGNATRTLLAPDTEPGKRGMGLRGVREAAKRDKKHAVYRSAAPRCPELLQASYFELKRSAAPGVDGMTWQEYGRRPGGTNPRPPRPRPSWCLLGTALQAGMDTQGRRTTTPPGHRCPGGQNRPAGRQDRARTNLRGGLPRLQLRVSARPKLPQRTGCVVGGHHAAEGKLGARRRHSWVL